MEISSCESWAMLQCRWQTDTSLPEGSPSSLCLSAPHFLREHCLSLSHGSACGLLVPRGLKLQDMTLRLWPWCCGKRSKTQQREAAAGLHSNTKDKQGHSVELGRDFGTSMEKAMYRKACPCQHSTGQRGAQLLAAARGCGCHPLAAPALSCCVCAQTPPAGSWPAPLAPDPDVDKRLIVAVLFQQDPSMVF